jgi:hypothetical protein
VVAGRIGDEGGESDVYWNPYGDGELCKNHCVGEYSTGTSQGNPDGYKACNNVNGSAWNVMITVWRNNRYTPIFDKGYLYHLQPMNANGAVELDVAAGGTSNGTALQQWTSSSVDSQKFQILDNGNGTWRLAMKGTGKCVDNPGGQTANGTRMQIWDCMSGDIWQQWVITPDVPTGAFTFRNVGSGRCLDEPGGSTASGVALDIQDCASSSAEKFRIFATP